MLNGLIGAAGGGAAASGGGFFSGLAGAFAPASLGAAVGTAGVGLAMGAAAGGLMALFDKSGKRAKRNMRKQQAHRLSLAKDGANAAKQSISQAAAESRATADQNMIDRGLFSSTLRDTTHAGINAAAGRDMAAADRAAANDQADILGQYQEGSTDPGLLSSLAAKFTAGVMDRAYSRPGQSPTDQSGDRTVDPRNADSIQAVRQRVEDVGRRDVSNTFEGFARLHQLNTAEPVKAAPAPAAVSGRPRGGRFPKGRRRIDTGGYFSGVSR